MIFYYLNVITIKIKYILFFIYFDLYKISLKLYFNLFKGPNISFSFFNTRNFIFYEYVITRSVFSPFFVFILINRGLFYILNFKFWIGSRLIFVKPQLNILRNNLRNMPLKYNRKKSLLRVISYHISMLQRNFFIKFIFVLFILEVFFIFYFFSKNFYFFILIFYFVISFYYIIFIKIYKYFVKIIGLGLKLSILKPISYSLNKNDYIGNLNNGLFLNISNYFFEIKQLFNKVYFLFYENLKKLKLNKSNALSIFNDKTKIYLNSFNFELSFIELFKNLNKFWTISYKQDKVLNNFFYNFTKRRLLYFQKNYNIYLNYLKFCRYLGLFYLAILEMCLNSKTLKIFLLKFFKKFNKLIFIFLGFNYVIYFFISFWYSFLIIILVFGFLVCDYILYNDYLTNFKLNNLLNYFYVQNPVINYNLEISLRLNEYDIFRIYNIEGFKISEYILLLKLEINIAMFEFFLNKLILEQEFFYKKKEILLNTEDIVLTRQFILNKYSILFKNYFNEILDIKIKKKNKELEQALLMVKNKSLKYFIILKNKVSEYNSIFYLDNNHINIEINNFILSELNINQRYYYITYGLKLLK